MHHPHRFKAKQKILEQLTGRAKGDIAEGLKSKYKTPPPAPPQAPEPPVDDLLKGLDEESLKKLLGG